MLKRAIDDYLAARRAAGFELGMHEVLLYSFERFASARDEVHVRTQTAVDWAALTPLSGQQARRLAVVTRFARYAKTEDPWHEIPPRRVFQKEMDQKQYLAFIFSKDDVMRILNAASRLGPRGSFAPIACRALFGLLAATGMRISEALALRFEDVTPDGLVVRQTKFKKSRMLPLHKTTEAALGRYLSRRRQVGGGDDHLFVASAKKALSYEMVRARFRRILRQLDLHAAPGKPAPRMHDLRHSFAVRALENCPTGDRDMISSHMLALSTYLGHSKVSNTYMYLQLTPHLVRDVSDACEAFFKEIQP